MWVYTRIKNLEFSDQSNEVDGDYLTKDDNHCDERMQLDVKPDAHRKTTIERKALKR